MKKNGFTLIEVLGVVTLLALLSVVVLVSVNKSLKNSVNTLSQAQIENIKSAASMWRTDHIELIPDNGYYVMTLNELIDGGYIDDVVDFKTESNYDRGLTLGIGINEIKIDSQDNLLDLNGYIKIDYVKSDGEQYIDLGYKAKKNTEIRLDIQFISNENTDTDTAYNYIVGRGSTDNKNATFSFNFGGEVYQKTEIFYWVDKTYASGGQIKSRTYGSSITNRSTMIVKSGSATFQGITIELATKTQDNTENMILLGGYTSTTQSVLAFNRYDTKIYGFQIYEGDKMIMNLVPYMKNNRAGLYDLVGNKFYLSDGTKDFLYEN